MRSARILYMSCSVRALIALCQARSKLLVVLVNLPLPDNFNLPLEIAAIGFEFLSTPELLVFSSLAAVDVAEIGGEVESEA